MPLLSEGKNECNNGPIVSPPTKEKKKKKTEGIKGKRNQRFESREYISTFCYVQKAFSSDDPSQ